MSEYSIPTTPLCVSLSLTDGRVLDGEIFLPSTSSVRDGPMLAGEWVNFAPPFVPVRSTVDRTVTLVARAHVVSIALDAGVPAADPEALVDARIRRVIVETAGGNAYEGWIAIAMPTHRQRLVDWLNNPDAYATVDVDGRVHLIQKTHILRIVDLGED
jgi:hypothetical protein